MQVKWRYLSLEQINRELGPGKNVWEQPRDYPGRGLLAFRAAEAARRQGDSAFVSFHMALLEAKHKDRCDLAHMDTIIQSVKKAGLDVAAFKKDLENSSLARLAEDHTFAVEKLGVFGTPTLVFPVQQAVFIKMTPPPPPEECLPLFNELKEFVSRRSNVLEVKRVSAQVKPKNKPGN